MERGLTQVMMMMMMMITNNDSFSRISIILKMPQGVQPHPQPRAKTKLKWLIYFFSLLDGPFPKNSGLNPLFLVFSGGY